jgi:hypothetical protein
MLNESNSDWDDFPSRIYWFISNEKIFGFIATRSTGFKKIIFKNHNFSLMISILRINYLG